MFGAEVNCVPNSGHENSSVTTGFRNLDKFDLRHWWSTEMVRAFKLKSTKKHLENQQTLRQSFLPKSCSSENISWGTLIVFLGSTIWRTGQKH